MIATANSNNIKTTTNNLNEFGLYDLEELKFQQDDIKQGYNKVLKPLTLFAPYVFEEEEALLHARDLPDEDYVMSINETLKVEPETFDELSDLIKERLKIKDLEYLNHSDQEELVQIAIKELKVKWKEMKRLVEDPFLTVEDNIELRRRLFVNSISICEKVYNYYLLKAKFLKSRKIFNDEANFCRVKTLMANDLNKFLNIHSLKHHLLVGMKNLRKSSNYNPNSAKTDETSHLLRQYTIDDLIDDFRLNNDTRNRKFRNKKEHLLEIYNNIPVLETKNLEKILNNVQKNVARRLQEETKNKTEIIEETQHVKKKKEYPSEEELLTRLASSDDLSVRTKRSKSMDKLTDITLADELNLDIEELTKEKFKTTDYIKIIFIYGLKVETKFGLEKKKIDFYELSKMSNQSIGEVLRKDLEELTYIMRKNQGIRYDDDDTLLMTLTSKPGHEKYMKELKRKKKAIDERYKKFMNEIKLPSNREMAHPQPATFEKTFFKEFPIRLSDIRVSTRVLRYNMSLQPFPPLYNNINGDIDSDMVQHLDRNLQIGGEIKEVYDELIKTISEDHLRFDMDDYVQPAPLKLNLDMSYTSAILAKKGITKACNQELINTGKQSPPWEDMPSREWNKTPLFHTTKKDDGNSYQFDSKPAVFLGANQIKAMTIKPEKIALYKTNDPSILTDKEFKNWFSWWLKNISFDDYLKYLSTQTNDYLSLIFHLYGTNESQKFIATEQELKIANAKRQAEIERNELLVELRKKKLEYIPGSWNPESVLLGGLGKDPQIEEKDDPFIKLQASLLAKQEKVKKINLFKKENVEEREEEEAKARMRAMLQPVEKDPPQFRLERIWTLLRMSDSEKLDMAIKYSTDEYQANLLPAIDEWEKAADLIIEREKCIFELENFERTASDPNRFFLKGNRGSSAARLEEAVIRDNLYKLIESLQIRIEKELIEIEKKFKDTIAYNGRNYLDKMKWDRIEMLHFLTEERRYKYFKHEIKHKKLRESINEL